MATLNDIAKQLTSLAQLNLTKKPNKAYDTGNLYRNIGSYNTPNRVLGKTKMGKKRKKLSNTIETIELNLSYNPPGADYGKYVEEGTSKMKARPFAEEAMDSPVLKKMIDDYMGIYVEETIIPGVMDELAMFDDIE